MIRAYTLRDVALPFAGRLNRCDHRQGNTVRDCPAWLRVVKATRGIARWPAAPRRRARHRRSCGRSRSSLLPLMSGFWRWWHWPCRRSTSKLRGRPVVSLKSAFCSHCRFSVLRGAMWNGWKKAAVGLSALLTFIALEIMAVAAGVAAFLSLVMDVDLPFLATSED